MDCDSLFLGNKVALAVCQALWSRPAGLTGREIARKTGFSPQAIHNSLKALKENKIVAVQIAGRSHVYSLNRAHFWLSECLIPLWKKMVSWKEYLGDLYMKNLENRPLSIVVFGSYSKDLQTRESDLDLLFIYPQTPSLPMSDAIRNLEGAVSKKFSVFPSCKTISLKDFKKEIRKKEGLMRTIYREGKVIAGKNLTDL